MLTVLAHYLWSDFERRVGLLGDKEVLHVVRKPKNIAAYTILQRKGTAETILDPLQATIAAETPDALLGLWDQLQTEWTVLSVANCPLVAPHVAEPASCSATKSAVVVNVLYQPVNEGGTALTFGDMASDSVGMEAAIKTAKACRGEYGYDTYIDRASKLLGYQANALCTDDESDLFPADLMPLNIAHDRLELVVELKLTLKDYWELEQRCSLWRDIHVAETLKDLRDQCRRPAEWAPIAAGLMSSV